MDIKHGLCIWDILGHRSASSFLRYFSLHLWTISKHRDALGPAHVPKRGRRASISTRRESLLISEIQPPSASQNKNKIFQNSVW